MIKLKTQNGKTVMVNENHIIKINDYGDHRHVFLTDDFELHIMDKFNDIEKKINGGKMSIKEKMKMPLKELREKEIEEKAIEIQRCTKCGNITSEFSMHNHKIVCIECIDKIK